MPDIFVRSAIIVGKLLGLGFLALFSVFGISSSLQDIVNDAMNKKHVAQQDFFNGLLWLVILVIAVIFFVAVIMSI